MLLFSMLFLFTSHVSAFHFRNFPTAIIEVPNIEDRNMRFSSLRILSNKQLTLSLGEAIPY